MQGQRNHLAATLPGSVIQKANALMQSDGSFAFGDIDFAYQDQQIEFVLNNEKAE